MSDALRKALAELVRLSKRLGTEEELPEWNAAWATAEQALFLPTAQAPAQEPTEEMLRAGYMACDHYIDTHCENDNADSLTEDQWHEMVGIAYRRMCAAAPPDVQEDAARCEGLIFALRAMLDVFEPDTDKQDYAVHLARVELDAARE